MTSVPDITRLLARGKPGGRAEAARRLAEANKLLDEVSNMLGDVLAWPGGPAVTGIGAVDYEVGTAPRLRQLSRYSVSRGAAPSWCPQQRNRGRATRFGLDGGGWRRSTDIRCSAAIWMGVSVDLDGVCDHAWDT